MNLVFSRLEVDLITQNERIALGEACAPLANKYLQGSNELIMPILVLAPILLSRLAQASKNKKEKELKEKYAVEEPQPEPQDRPTSNKWSKLSHGKD